jgi:hypothetical protein
MVHGVVYTTAGSRRAVVALDGATGECTGCTAKTRGRAEPMLPGSFPSVDWLRSPEPKPAPTGSADRSIRKLTRFMYFREERSALTASCLPAIETGYRASSSGILARRRDEFAGLSWGSQFR